jgi:hypothetical protein
MKTSTKIRIVLIVVVVVAAVLNFIYLSRKEDQQLIEPPIEPDTTIVKTKPVKVKPVKEWIWFIDKKEKYRFRFPGNWQFNDYSTGDRLIRADINDGELAGLQVRVQTNVKQDFNAFVEAYLNQFMDDMASHWKGPIDVIDQKFERIGKHEGFRAALVLKRQDGQKWFLKEFLWKRGEKVVIFQAGALSGWVHIYEPLFDKIAGSFSFL